MMQEQRKEGVVTLNPTHLMPEQAVREGGAREEMNINFWISLYVYIKQGKKLLFGHLSFS